MKAPFKFLIYQSAETDVTVNTIVKNETIWLSQKAMAELFAVEVPAINKHLANIYTEGELNQDSTISKMEIVQIEGKRKVKRTIDCYNLDAIISVGYRVNSRKATQFRIWQKITDIFAECSIDYDKDDAITHDFYAMVQNRFHYAITGQTAAEIIYNKADRNKDYMGLTTWKDAPEGRILPSDVTIAKNYLTADEIAELENAVTGFFDYIDRLIRRRNTFTMAQFAESVDRFLSFNEYEILEGKGTVSKKQADAKAKKEYSAFSKTQRITSDFDREVQKMITARKQ